MAGNITRRINRKASTVKGPAVPEATVGGGVVVWLPG
jgi:hypothetical protein